MHGEFVNHRECPRIVHDRRSIGGVRIEVGATASRIALHTEHVLRAKEPHARERRLDDRPDLGQVLRVLLWPVVTGIPLPKHRLVLHAKAVHIDADVLVHLQTGDQPAREGIDHRGIEDVAARGVSRSYQRRIAGAPVRQAVGGDNALVVGRRRPNPEQRLERHFARVRSGVERLHHGFLHVPLRVLRRVRRRGRVVLVAPHGDAQVVNHHLAPRRIEHRGLVLPHVGRSEESKAFDALVLRGAIDGDIRRCDGSDQTDGEARCDT